MGHGRKEGTMFTIRKSQDVQSKNLYGPWIITLLTNDATLAEKFLKRHYDQDDKQIIGMDT